MHMLEKTFITIIHLAEWKVIAKADVIAVPPGTVGVCGQKHISYSHRSNSQTTDILCRLHPPQSSRSNASWKIFSSAREPKPLRGSYTKHPVNIRAMRAFLPVLLDTDKQWVCIHPCTAYHHVFYFLVLRGFISPLQFDIKKQSRGSRRGHVCTKETSHPRPSGFLKLEQVWPNNPIQCTSV